MASSYRFVVTGQVQGVYFRQSAVDEARRLGISGWVRNRQDGAVEGVAAGAVRALQQFRQWLQHGPGTARVEGVEWMDEAEDPAGDSFVIRR